MIHAHEHIIQNLESKSIIKFNNSLPISVKIPIFFSQGYNLVCISNQMVSKVWTHLFSIGGNLWTNN